jgi:hypothetical protein
VEGGLFHLLAQPYPCLLRIRKHADALIGWITVRVKIGTEIMSGARLQLYATAPHGTGLSEYPKRLMERIEENEHMRKSVVDKLQIHAVADCDSCWLKVEDFAAVEVTSEDPNFPIESAFHLWS